MRKYTGIYGTSPCSFSYCPGPPILEVGMAVHVLLTIRGSGLRHAEMQKKRGENRLNLVGWSYRYRAQQVGDGLPASLTASGPPVPRKPPLRRFANLARGEVSPRCIPSRHPANASRKPGVCAAPPAARKGGAVTAALKKERTAPRSESRQRAKRETIRFLDEEHAAIREKAANANLSVGAYLRACALGDAGPRARRSPTIDRELASKAIAELNKAGSNLNQIAHAVNLQNWPGTSPVVEAAGAVKSAALQILRAFGYKTHDSQGEPTQ